MRGLNVLPSAKVPDFEPIKDLSTLDTIKPYGVNAVRCRRLCYQHILGVTNCMETQSEGLALSRCVSLYAM